MDHALTLKPIVDTLMSYALDYGKSKLDKIKEASESNFIKELGIFALVFLVIILVIVVLFLLEILIRSQSPIVIKLKEKIRNKIFFTSIYRYLIASEMKITASLLTGIMVTEWSFETVVD